MRYCIHNLHTGQRYEFTDADLRDGETPEARIARKANVYGRGERREPAASDLGGWRIEADADGELWLVQSATITATETRTPLRDARPGWYDVGAPRLDGDAVVVPAEYRVEVVDTAAEDRAALLDRIYLAYEDAERRNLTPAGAIQLAEWCAAGVQRALDVRVWLQALYAERDQKLAAVEGGDMTVDPEPSTPWKPWTFREIGTAPLVG